ncbi:extracellular solute-binding protein [Candidatus Falkowbacteria bacterium]|jgi:multiple sugar transport system substrate-binding protein|nr:extracellular solute-binding protein [Candidatus Falkowbacteria bacterium]MBT4432920.1 extracellular solute-binding protein [Candidatus Falkowbacteria bacterium]
MRKQNPSFKILLLIIVLLLSTGFQCKCTSNDIAKQLKPITLEYWGVWDDSEVMNRLILKYQIIHPNITVKYKKLRYEEYERSLLEGWADGQGPDIFSIHNTWVPKYKDKILPMPKSIELPYVSYKAAIPGCEKKTEQVITSQKTHTISLSELKNNYSGTVYHDSVLNGEIYALPFFLDTLALFYNRDLLDSANIPFPPADWDEFIEDVRLLTQYDVDRNIIQSGAALGTFENIDRSVDILSLLMMQNGVDLSAFASKGSNLGRSTEALEFYLDFADPQREIYTWNNEKPNALDAFSEGNLAFFIGYSYHIPLIKQKAPILNFSISEIPQVNLSNPINYANYWTQTVFKRSKYTKEAWDFILFLSQEENVKEYLKDAKRPTALRSLIKTQEKDPMLKSFATQVLTADSWHEVRDFNHLEKAFQKMFSKIYSDEPQDLGTLLRSVNASIQTLK